MYDNFEDIFVWDIENNIKVLIIFNDIFYVVWYFVLISVDVVVNRCLFLILKLGGVLYESICDLFYYLSDVEVMVKIVKRIVFVVLLNSCLKKYYIKIIMSENFVLEN